MADFTANPLQKAWENFLGREARPRRLEFFDGVCLLGLYPLVLALLLVDGYSAGHIISSPEGDIAYFWLWQRTYLGQLLSRGSLAAINPYIMAGTPFLAALQSAAFYPLNLLLLLWSAGGVINAQLLGHWYATFAGFHVLGMRLRLGPAAAGVVALAAGASGWVVLHNWQGHLPFLLEMAYTPWLLVLWVNFHSGHLRTTPYVLGASGLLALEFFVGHPQVFYCTLLLLAWLEFFWLVIASRWLGWVGCVRRALALAVASAVTGCLVAVQALPAWLYMRYTVRGEAAIPEAYYTAQSMPWSNLLTLVAPWVWGGWPGRDVYVGLESMWEVTAFVGASTAMLAIFYFLSPRRVSPWQWTWGGLALLGGVLALGEYSGFYSELRKLVPGLAFFRNPGRFLYLTTIALAMLGGESLERATRAAREQRSEFLALLARGWAFLGVCLASFLVLFSDGIRSPIFMHLLVSRLTRQDVAELTREQVVKLFENFQVNLLGAGLMMGLTLAAVSRLLWLRSVRYVRGAIVLFVAFELTQFARPYASSFAPERYLWPARVVRFLNENADGYRVSSIRTPADLNQGMIHGVRHVWGYEPTVALRYASALAVSQGRAPGFPEAWLSVSRLTPLLHALGVKYLVAGPGADLTAFGWRLVLDTLDCSLHENPLAMRRGYVVGRSTIMAEDEVLQVVNSRDFQPTTTVILEKGDVGAQETSSALQRAVVRPTADKEEHFAAELELDAPGWFVLMDQCLPGWSARVDGTEVRIVRANAVGMAVAVPAGRHRVEFTYRAPGLRSGAALSLASWIAYAAAWALWWRQRKKLV